MESRKSLFKAIELEMDTQKVFFDLNNKSQESAHSHFSDDIMCRLDATISTPDTGNEINKASFEIFIDNMRYQLKKYAKKFGFKFKVKDTSTASVMSCKVEIRRK